MRGHELDILQDPLTDRPHVHSLEAEEFELLTDGLQVDVFEAVLGHFKRWVDLAVDDASFEVKLAQLVLNMEEQVVHEQDMNFTNVLHLNCVDAIDLCNHARRVVLQMF